MLINKQTLIIALSRKEITVSLVDTSNNKILEETKKDWDPEKPEGVKEIVESLIKTLGKNKVRILLKEDLSYVVELPLTENISRKEIYSKVQGKIPEELDEYSWDFKKFEEEDKERIIAFAPVKHIYENVVKPLKEADMEIEAVEPESISNKRNENPIIGIALKKDIKGKDESVLNLKSKDFKPKTKNEEKEKNSKKENKKKSPNKKGRKKSSNKKENKKEKINLKSKKNILLIAVTLILFLGAGGILANYFLSNKKEENNAPEQIERQQPEKNKNEEQSKNKDKEEEEEENPRAIIEETTLLILNGTGATGRADTVKETLEAEGFKEIEVDNAESISYEKTLVRSKEETPEIILTTIERALNSDYDLEFSEEYLPEESENSVILIVGQRIN